MASSKMVSRLCSKIQPFLLKSNKKTSSSISADTSIFNSTFHPQASASSGRNCISRLPVELSSLLTMTPLHSAIASARLQSNLSIDSQSWCLVPQDCTIELLARLSFTYNNRKTLIYLILTLYHMYPDYDFSAMNAHQFFTEGSWDCFKQIFDVYMFDASKEWVVANEGNSLLDNLYKALDEVIALVETN